MADSEELREFERLVENLPGMAYRCRNEQDWPMEYVSDGCHELTGYDGSALVSGDVSWGEDVLHEEDSEGAWESVQRALEGGEQFEVSYRIERADGEIRWCSEQGRGVFRDGELTFIEGHITDVTERKRHEQSLERYRTLVETVGDPMYMLDVDGTIRMANEAMAAHIGYDREEIVGETPAAFMPREDMVRGTEVTAELLDAPKEEWQSWEMEAIHASGDRFHNEIKTSIVYEDGEYAGSVGVVRDIEDRKQRERELQRYETIVQAIGDPVYALDETGRITFVNDALEEMTGYDSDELVGEHVETLVDDEAVERGREFVDELLAADSDDTIKFEIETITKCGERIPCELKITVLPFDEEFRGTAGVVREITERKQREQRLESFAGTVAHDLRGPLNSISGWSDLARETGEEQYFDRLENAIEQMEAFIDDLLTLAREGKSVGETEHVAVARLADRAWEHIETNGGSLEVSADETITCDPSRIQQVFENLFRNAIEHGEGDPINVRVGTHDNGLYVADDGPGIPPEKRDQIFDHGYTTSQSGTGFGLSIVERIVEGHGWEIDVTESEAGGARFEIHTR